MKIVIVPVAGHGPAPAPAPAAVLDLPDSRQIVAAVPALLAGPAWRERLSRACPLPQLAARAPAIMAASAVAAARAAPGTPVHVARSYLAPLAVAVAEQLGSPWATADLDDDDQCLAAASGRQEESLAYGRLVSVFGPLFRSLAVASAAEADAIRGRHGLVPIVIPNAVAAVPGGLPRSAGAADDAVALLYVGNLTYWPNADAAIRLVRDILPRVRAMVSRPVTVTLAGDTGTGDTGTGDMGTGDWLRDLARQPGVRVTGFVPDLAHCYRSAGVVVVPLAFGAGTRIKLLEAFAFGVPVVTTSQGAAGLAVTDGVHALIADSPAGLAAAVARLTLDGRLRDRLVANARQLVTEHYSQAVLIPQIRDFFRAAASALPGRAGRV